MTFGSLFWAHLTRGLPHLRFLDLTGCQCSVATARRAAMKPVERFKLCGWATSRYLVGVNEKDWSKRKGYLKKNACFLLCVFFFLLPDFILKPLFAASLKHFAAGDSTMVWWPWHVFTNLQSLRMCRFADSSCQTKYNTLLSRLYKELWHATTNEVSLLVHCPSLRFLALHRYALCG